MPRHRLPCWRQFALLLAAASLGAFPNVGAGVTIRQSAVNPANNHLYHLLRGDGLGAGVTPVEAEAYATTLGGHLVTLNDFDEDFWVTTTLRVLLVYRA